MLVSVDSDHFKFCIMCVYVDRYVQVMFNSVGANKCDIHGVFNAVVNVCSAC